jgi:hypothetical protein
MGAVRSKAEMTMTDNAVEWVKAALAEMGVALPSDVEYREVAMRLSAVVETVQRLMAELPDHSEALSPADLPLPPHREASE